MLCHDRPLITYGGTKRKLALQDEFPIKHRRVADFESAIPSSSPDDDNFSPLPSDSPCPTELDSRDTTQTPPSSPPLCPAISITRKPMIEKKKPLIQMQLNVGARTQKSCKDCGMTYTLSSMQDVMLHKAYHEQGSRGLDIGRACRKTLETRGPVVRSSRGPGIICMADRTSTVAVRKKAMEALNIAQVELGAVDISELELWSLIGHTVHGPNEKRPRYKLYLYILGTRCVGICLAESIASAARTRAEDDVLTLTTANVPAVVGISRIWVARNHRRQGLAVDMLDAVRDTFSESVAITKDRIAFSQPTESGGALAAQWLGQEFLVYAG